MNGTALSATLGCLLAAGVETLAPGAAPHLGPAVLAAASWVAAAVVARRARRSPGGRDPWGPFAGVALLLGTGQLLSALTGAGVNTGTGSWPDLPLVVAVPLGAVASLRMLPRTRARHGFGARAVLDGGVVLLAVVVAVQVLIGGGTTAAELVVPVFYPAVGAVFCGIGLAVLGAVPPERRPAALRMLGSFLALTAVSVSGAVAGTRDAALLDVGTGVAWILMLACAVRAAAVDLPGTGTPAAAAAPALPMTGVLTSHALAVGVSVVVAVRVVLDLPLSPPIAVETSLLLALTLARSVLWAADARRLTGRLRRTEGYFRALVHSGGDVTLVLDRNGRITWVSGDVRGRLDLSEDELTGRSFASLAHDDDRAAVAAVLAWTEDDRPAGARVPLCVRLRARGGWRGVEISGIAGADDGLVLHVRDLTERRRTELELERMAYTDFLTGLPNRARLMSSLDAARARATGPGQFSLLMVDLDGFKPVNDVAGHEAGDDLLVQVAGRLRATVRDRDLISRLGGDEFAVLVRAGLDEGAALAQRIVAELGALRPTALAGGHADDELVFDVTASVGVAELDPADDVATTIRRADLALRAAKQAGKNCVRLHADTPDDAAERRARLARDLSVAIEAGQLRLLFQPVVGVAERRVLGLEALVRWEHPRLGLVPPEEFIGLAEAEGLIVPLQRWVLRAATAALAPLLAEGRDLQLGVNISVRHLQAGCLAPDVARAVAESGVPPRRLMIEITESVLMAGDDQFEVDLTTLREMGCVISLDDFGKGYSSLARLARLPVDVLKMDRDFIGHMVGDPRSTAIVGGVVELGRTLGIDVVAEGVETPEQLAALRELGCRFLQGYLLGRPVAAEELPGMLDGFDAGLLDTGVGLTDADLAVH